MDKYSCWQKCINWLSLLLKLFALLNASRQKEWWDTSWHTHDFGRIRGGLHACTSDGLGLLSLGLLGQYCTCCTCNTPLSPFTPELLPNVACAINHVEVLVVGNKQAEEITADSSYRLITVTPWIMTTHGLRGTVYSTGVQNDKWGNCK